MNTIDNINWKEVLFFYHSPQYSFTDFSEMKSFSLIKSCIEIFSYYGINDFSSDDIKNFFEKLALVQKKNVKVFLPSLRKIEGVLECYTTAGMECLQTENHLYHIVSWNTDGYRYTVQSGKADGKI